MSLLNSMPFYPFSTISSKEKKYAPPVILLEKGMKLPIFDTL